MQTLTEDEAHRFLETVANDRFAALYLLALTTGMREGELLATAFSLESSTPLIYPRLKPEGTGPRGVEGRFSPGARALLVDDLITGGSNMLETAAFLNEQGITVHDAVVLVDRDQGAYARLKQAGIHLVSILKLDVMMNLYRSIGLIDEETDAHSRGYQQHWMEDSERGRGPGWRSAQLVTIEPARRRAVCPDTPLRVDSNSDSNTGESG